MNLLKRKTYKKPAIEDDLDFEEEDKDYDDFEEDDKLDDFNDFSDNYSAPSPMDKHNDLLKSLTNFNPYLTELRYKWLGMTWSAEKGKYIVNPHVRPLMNEVGVEWVIGHLSVFARNNNILSTLKEEHFWGLMHDTIDVMYLNLVTRCEEFGIREETAIGDILKICNEAHATVVLILSGAGKTDNYQKFLGTAVTRNEHIALNNNPAMQQPQQKGFLDKSFSWIRGR